MSSHYTQS